MEDYTLIGIAAFRKAPNPGRPRVCTAYAIVPGDIPEKKGSAL
ncbi:MAG TPA: hypothetical protein VLD67_00380 [Vicinamibacterales bacterium]|nr:hypothetical protein [Vicinamibacterales bacterium]